MKWFTLITRNCFWLLLPFLLIEQPRKQNEVTKNESDAEARNLGTRSHSLYSSIFSLCTFIISYCFSLWITRSLSPWGYNNNIQNTGKHPQHMPVLLPAPQLLSPDSSAGTTRHFSFKCPYAVCHRKVQGAFYPSSFVSIAPWRISFSVPESLCPL